MERMHAHVASGSWALQGVEAGEHQRPWAYTIGLMQHFGHPELVITDGAWRESAVILNQLGEWVRKGDRFVPGMVVESDGGAIELGVLRLDRSRPRLVGNAPGHHHGLEILRAPPGNACRTCGPGGFAMSGNGPNRMERRRAARRRH